VAAAAVVVVAVVLCYLQRSSWQHVRLLLQMAISMKIRAAAAAAAFTAHLHTPLLNNAPSNCD
jgi:hypothetical protein